MKRNNRTGVVLGLKATATKVSEEKIAKNPLVRAFALRFRQWRREQGRTLRQVATDLDMSIGTISEWENCKRYLLRVNGLRGTRKQAGKGYEQ